MFSGVTPWKMIVRCRMVISESKKRVPVTLDKDIWEYLEERVRIEKKAKNKKGQITVSTILNELARNDKKIRDAFR